MEEQCLETRTVLQGKYVERILEWSVGTFAETEFYITTVTRSER